MAFNYQETNGKLPNCPSWFKCVVAICMWMYMVGYLRSYVSEWLYVKVIFVVLIKEYLFIWWQASLPLFWCIICKKVSLSSFVNLLVGYSFNFLRFSVFLCGWFGCWSIHISGTKMLIGKNQCSNKSQLNYLFYFSVHIYATSQDIYRDVYLKTHQKHIDIWM